MEILFDSFIGTHYIEEEEKKAALEVLDSKSLFRYDGPHFLNKTGEFEGNLRDFLGCENVLACSSGAGALKLCCVSLGIGPGDEVIMSPFTYIASAGAVMACGAVPVFVDVDESMNIDPDLIASHITDRTKAIMAIHMQGIPCDMRRIMEIALKNDLKVIEDCAQAFGAKYAGRLVGTWGDAAAFSLQANKVITCGEGGIFVCKDRERFLNGVRFHDNGGKREGLDYPVWNDPICSFGENMKITELQSAIANEQLKKAERIITRQRVQYKKLCEQLIPMKKRKVIDNIDYVPESLCLIFEHSEQCDSFIKNINEVGVAFDYFSDRVLTTYNTFLKQKSWGLHNMPYCFTNYKLNPCEYTYGLSKRTAWLSIHPLWDDDQITYIAEQVNKVYKAVE